MWDELDYKIKLLTDGETWQQLQARHKRESNAWKLEHFNSVKKTQKPLEIPQGWEPGDRDEQNARDLAGILNRMATNETYEDPRGLWEYKIFLNLLPKYLTCKISVKLEKNDYNNGGKTYYKKVQDTAVLRNSGYTAIIGPKLPG